jgi:hypothetical protein
VLLAVTVAGVLVTWVQPWIQYTFGISDHRMTISVAGTPWLWACCGFIAALIVVYEWLLTCSRPRLQPDGYRLKAIRA